jgi:hypothetical protein
MISQIKHCPRVNIGHHFLEFASAIQNSLQPADFALEKKCNFTPIVTSALPNCQNR